jgi:hypothetical protein
MQLDLFAGTHVPMQRCHAALGRGDLPGARAALAQAAACDGQGSLVERVAALEEKLPALGGEAAAPAEAVHEAFANTLAGEATRTADPIRSSDWFRLYAAHMAAALASAPERRVRHWCALHYELAARRPQFALRAALRLTSTCGEGWAWLEAARAAHAAGEEQLARRWVLMACLVAGEALPPDAPQLAPTSIALLDAPGSTLPALPLEFAALWGEAVCLELPEPASAWVPCIGALDGEFAMDLLRSAELREATGFDPSAAPSRGEPKPWSFLRALAAALDARSRALSPGRCGEAELRARVEMRNAAPVLFSRYLDRLGFAGWKG